MSLKEDPAPERMEELREGDAALGLSSRISFTVVPTEAG